ncbi:catalase family protein [Caballeronia sp. LZ065]|uniref:catalase family protein n=1 Tax=Caballeronia sp. LZ065 TaxID=3038571 RepID=UPI00285D8FF2|nr:catalase family protein [Caballeronia sp. LZ065]MDR5780654.1 catalase family protein [Caballeronia sp. LZ065]
MCSALVHALPFDAAFEVIPDDEAATTAALVKAMRAMCDTTYRDHGHAMRSVHARTHGLVVGELSVLGALPAHYAQGVFARAMTVPVVMRFSTNRSDGLDDRLSTPRGLALKLIGVKGVRLPGSELDITQDFVMINAPVFMSGTPKAFLSSLLPPATPTGTTPRIRGQAETHILGETFYSAGPLLYGDYFAKMSVAPVSAPLIDMTDALIDMNGKPHGMREAVSAFFAAHDGEWELRVQLATDIERMPVEDASVRWPEGESPYVAVARIRVGRQSSWDAARVATIDEGMAFSPWRGVAAHRPLGGLMRSRKAAYDMSAHFRRERNGCPMTEPTVAPGTKIKQA